MFGNRNRPAPAETANTNAPSTAASSTSRAGLGATSGFAAPSRQSSGRGGAGAMGVTTSAADQGTLIVGRDIKLAGEINACETLVVEGVVNADLRDTRSLEVHEGGAFSGSANVDRAEVNGTFEGELFVSGLLVISTTGRVSGKVQCGEMELQRGGVVSGTVEMTSLKGGRLGNRTATRAPLGAEAQAEGPAQGFAPVE